MGKKVKLLIVDDNENQCKTLVAILSAGGYDARAARTASEAIDAVKASPPDLVLLDLVLKGDKDGAELFRDIKKISPRTKAVLITGHAIDGYSVLRNAWMEEGIVEEYLRKEIDPDELLAAIVKHTKGIVDA